MEATYNAAAWSAFFSAQAGASAALAGLIFVAVSINLSKIIAARWLVARAAKALVALVGVLLAATLGMTPAQPQIVLGSELTALGLVVWLLSTIAQHRSSYKNPYVGGWQKVLHIGITQIAAIPFLIAGISIGLGRGGGLYWIVPAMAFSYVEALVDAWVLMVEILR